MLRDIQCSPEAAAKREDDVRFSVKMRSSLGSVHGRGGRHISGAERIVPESALEYTVREMLRRSRTHERGRADFIQIKVEEIRLSEAVHAPLLSYSSIQSSSKDEGRRIAADELIAAGVGRTAVIAGFRLLEALRESMRGAMVLDAGTGERLDTLPRPGVPSPDPERGIRCTSMDIADEGAYQRLLERKGLSGDLHAREALVLASKVVSDGPTVAELCWSDDPGHTKGYVASRRNGYRRISVMKDLGDQLGGRIFFVRHGTDIAEYADYMENTPVLIEIQEGSDAD
ncbi:MAG: 6-carboxyhexanoate--CoA ligase [Succinivibrionaceae bacterium]|nr:6-carboxyhexanoate--CoA ligase [Pseudomonadota bacterium]MDY3144476.1 6-carboxyhexanoate--CoA ligase [Succinivibrionaceae bacterium]